MIDVEAAAARIRGVAHRTPVVTCTTLDERTDARLLLKAENLQKAGAFKFRGAYNRLRTLDSAELSGGVVASSSGNHAQALALAARLCGTRATILMPHDAPESKVAATRGYGAEIVRYDRYSDDQDALASQLAEGRGAALVHPYEDPEIIAGAGTVALELLCDAHDIEALVVCVGGGGLLAGCCMAVAATQAETLIYGVEPAASDDWCRSFRAGRRVSVDVGPTIADGQQLTAPGQLNFDLARPYLTDVVSVTDDEIRHAMRIAFERAKLVLEPSGATALAALLAGKLEVAGLRVGVTLSGGNIDAQRFAELLGERH